MWLWKRDAKLLVLKNGERDPGAQEHGQLLIVGKDKERDSSLEPSENNTDYFNFSAVRTVSKI